MRKGEDEMSKISDNWQQNKVVQHTSSKRCTRDTTELEPPDLEQCQAERIVYRPCLIGGTPHQRERCKKIPQWLLIEKKAGEDGQIGSMAVCTSCLEELKIQEDESLYNITKIEG